MLLISSFEPPNQAYFTLAFPLHFFSTALEKIRNDWSFACLTKLEHVSFWIAVISVDNPKQPKPDRNLLLIIPYILSPSSILIKPELLSSCTEPTTELSESETSGSCTSSALELVDSANWFPNPDWAINLWCGEYLWTTAAASSRRKEKNWGFTKFSIAEQSEQVTKKNDSNLTSVRSIPVENLILIEYKFKVAKKRREYSQLEKQKKKSKRINTCLEEQKAHCRIESQ